MGKTCVFMFSGQGSHYYGMGRELFIQNPVFRKWMKKQDEIVGDLTGESVLDKLYDGEKKTGDPFNRVLYSHPAIFMVEYAMFQVMLEIGAEPDYLMGASLGEFVAAAAAGVMDVTEVLEMVIRQARDFENYCQSGGMTAVLHDVNLFYQNHDIYENCELAALNYSSHFVVSGEPVGLKNVERFFADNGIIYQRLPVAYGFHSALIDPAAQAYKNFLETRQFKDPAVPFISCQCGKITGSLPDGFFWDVVRKMIQFQRAVESLERVGNHIYLDLGPGGTLDNFVKRILAPDALSESCSIINPFNREPKQMQIIKGRYFSNQPKMRRSDQKMKAHVFPGQGSQYLGMGGSLFDEFPDITESADEVLGYSIKDLCLRDPERCLRQTQYTQPALYTVNALSYLKKIRETGTMPDYVAGHSLGEYNALLAAGVFDFATGLQLVKKRGALMSRAAGGGMAAILGVSAEQIEIVLKKSGLTDIEIANFNTPSQTVIAGSAADIERAGAVFGGGEVAYIPLNVSGAFHSSYMAASQREFGTYLDTFRFAEPSIPVISNVYARPYGPGTVKNNLMRQITSPVKWTESIRYLMGLGEMEFEEIGPGEVLTKLIYNIQREARPLVLSEEEKLWVQKKN